MSKLVQPISYSAMHFTCIIVGFVQTKGNIQTMSLRGIGNYSCVCVHLIVASKSGITWAKGLNYIADCAAIPVWYVHPPNDSSCPRDPQPAGFLPRIKSGSSKNGCMNSCMSYTIMTGEVREKIDDGGYVELNQAVAYGRDYTSSYPPTSCYFLECSGIEWPNWQYLFPWCSCSSFCMDRAG